MSVCQSNADWRLSGCSWRATCSNGKLNSIYLYDRGVASVPRFATVATHAKTQEIASTCSFQLKEEARCRNVCRWQWNAWVPHQRGNNSQCYAWMFAHIPICHANLPVKYFLKITWLFLTSHLFKWHAEFDLLGQRRAFCTQVRRFCNTCEDAVAWTCLFQAQKKNRRQVDFCYPCRKPGSSQGSWHFAGSNVLLREFVANRQPPLLLSLLHMLVARVPYFTCLLLGLP